MAKASRRSSASRKVNERPGRGRSVPVGGKHALAAAPHPPVGRAAPPAPVVGALLSLSPLTDREAESLIARLEDALVVKDGFERVQQVERRLHAAGECSGPIGPGCPLILPKLQDSVVICQVATLLYTRDKRRTIWPDFSRHSSMYRPPEPMSAEKKAELRSLTKQRDIGDEVAILLRECGNLDSVYECAAKYLKMKVNDLRQKYGHLNPGQQRMNLGNKMRFVAKQKAKEGK